MKRYQLASMVCMSVLLLGSLMTPPHALATDTVRDQAKGSLLVFPMFDVIGGNQTKIEITNRAAAAVTARVTYICQPLGASTVSGVCNTFAEDLALAHNQTIILDVGTQLFGACPTGQGYIVVWAEQRCTAASPGSTCPTATGGTVPDGHFAPISYNQLYGSYNLYFNGFANAPTVMCGGRPCSPPPTGPVPDVEAANA